ncbi:hypothetical protein AGMMS50229_18170 [Campylobacterota bacterium]|nr:hypothetical protein AGMMS50229_18170 [Campylobacterota bacterium]
MTLLVMLIRSPSVILNKALPVILSEAKNLGQTQILQSLPPQLRAWAHALLLRRSLRMTTGFAIQSEWLDSS